MFNTKFSVLLCLLVLTAIVVLCGCSDTQIQFNRKSSFAEYVKKNNITNTKEEKPTATKSRGIVIYKASDSSSQKYNINFGPADINFNLPNQ